jgi:hypothetical protein
MANPSFELQPPPDSAATADKVADTAPSAASFNIEITPRKDATTGATVRAVIVTIDDHETVLTFQSQQDAESFAQTERVRLTADEKKRRLECELLNAPKSRKAEIRGDIKNLRNPAAE